MHESGIGPYGLRNRQGEKRNPVCTPPMRDRFTIRSGLRGRCMRRASPEARQSSASSAGLILPTPAPWPRSQPGRHRAGGARRRLVQPPLAGSPRPPSGTLIARLGRPSLQLLRRQRGQGGKLLLLLLRPPEGRDVSGRYHKGLRKPLQIPPHPFFLKEKTQPVPARGGPDRRSKPWLRNCNLDHPAKVDPSLAPNSHGCRQSKSDQFFHCGFSLPRRILFTKDGHLSKHDSPEPPKPGGGAERRFPNGGTRGDEP